MLLALDIGNTHLTCGLFRGVQLLRTLRFEVKRCGESGQLAAAIVALLAEQASQASDVKSAIIASVVPHATGLVQREIMGAAGVQARIVVAQMFEGLATSRDSLSEVGADRLLNALAAQAQYCDGEVHCGVIVVDMGTATTFDCVSPRGQFLGGAIASGVGSSQRGLVQAAAQLREVPLKAPPFAVGTSTRTAMQSGLVFGHAALVDGMVTRLRQELGFSLRVVATGGFSAVVAPYCQAIEQVQPHLTLQGLRLLSEQIAAPIALP